VIKWLRRISRWPPRGTIDFGELRRTTPIDRVFGFDRGQPIDRFYIEQYLSAHAADIRGHVLEVGGREYASRFGQDRVTHCDVLHVEAGHPGATIVADLADAGGIPSETFDCIICTQTLQHIYRVRDVLTTLHRVLKPGGVLLFSVPGISQISRFDMDRWGDYWRFTTLSARRLCEECFAPANVTVEAHGTC
jgi:SAM-dependent methyltransferase